MSDPFADWVRGQPKKPKKLSPDERKALARLRREAKKAGATLRNYGRGGLPPSLALGVMRRDGFTCKVHGDHGEGENGGLTLHHKGGTGLSAWLRSKGTSNDVNNLVTICHRAHGNIHEHTDKIEEVEA
ncbi:hypothetical protein LCGC14_0414590 [marine sediment metagenome]|uniref:Uncharacterized protein n=1 Tax=marine sediment metagenome TaxID=412755 RepID=A0A0F9SYN8_9ZZZZ